jgi:hypothetical protein
MHYIKKNIQLSLSVVQASATQLVQSIRNSRLVFLAGKNKNIEI